MCSCSYACISHSAFHSIQHYLSRFEIENKKARPWIGRWCGKTRTNREVYKAHKAKDTWDSGLTLNNIIYIYKIYIYIIYIYIIYMYIQNIHIFIIYIYIIYIYIYIQYTYIYIQYIYIYNIHIYIYTYKIHIRYIYNIHIYI